MAERVLNLPNLLMLRKEESIKSQKFATFEKLFILLSKKVNLVFLNLILVKLMLVLLKAPFLFLLFSF